MKNIIFKQFLFAVTIMIGMVSCEDRELITIENQSAAIITDLSTENLFLDENFPGNTALTVNWESATFTVPVEVKYRVEISASESFETPQVLTSTTQSQTYSSFTTLEMNNAAKKIGLLPNVAQKMYFRVVSYLATDDLLQTSNVTSLMITPYLARPTYNYADLYLIGNSAVGSWDNNAANMSLIPLLKTANSAVYTHTGYFKASVTDPGFKIIKVKGSWDAQYGAGAAAGQLSADGGSGNLTVPSDGYYKLTIDTSALTYTLVPVDNPIKSYTNISIIGTVNGDWNNDTQLTQSTFDSHLWMATSVSLNAGEFKFRADNAWDVSWGVATEFFGTTTIGGANIPLSAEWTYDIYFNDATGDYTFIPVQ